MAFRITIGVLTLTAGLLGCAAWWLLPEKASLGPLENIHGIPFPREGTGVLVTEKLAHADVYLQRSPIARTAELTVTFTPLTEEKLALGLRENSFWLSYPQTAIYERNADRSTDEQPRLRSITIPLTDKLPDRDNSLDLMFFARGGTAEPDEGTADQTRWLLHDLHITTHPALPSRIELKDALRRLITREQVR